MRRNPFVLYVVFVAFIIMLALPGLALDKGGKGKPEPNLETTPVSVTFFDECPTYECPPVDGNPIPSRIISDGGSYVDGLDDVEAVLWSGSQGSKDLTVNMYKSARRIKLEFFDENLDSPNTCDPRLVVGGGSGEEYKRDCPSVFIDRLDDVPIDGSWDPMDPDGWCYQGIDAYDGPNICVIANDGTRYVLKRATFYIDEDIKRTSFQLRFQSQPGVLSDVVALEETVYVRIYHPNDDTYIIRPETEFNYSWISADIVQEESPNRAGILVFSKPEDYVCAFFKMPFYLVVTKQQQ